MGPEPTPTPARGSTKEAYPKERVRGKKHVPFREVLNFRLGAQRREGGWRNFGATSDFVTSGAGAEFHFVTSGTAVTQQFVTSGREAQTYLKTLTNQ